MSGNLSVKKERQANLELLRMLSMYMVVVMHLFATGAESLAEADFGGISYFAVWYVDTLCHAADICFILISAYFLVMLPFRLSRLLRLWLMVLFYTVSGLLLSFAFSHTPFSRGNLLYAFFPVTSSAYWFITQYFLLVSISPLLNRLIRSLTKQEHRRAILLLMILFSVIPTFFFWSDSYFSDGFDLPWLVTIYFVGAYIRLHGLSIRRPGLKYFAVALFLTVSRVVLGAAAIRLTGSFHGAGLLYHGGLFYMVMAVCLFGAFQRFEIRNELCAKYINSVASCAIGVYLLHKNRFFPRLAELARLEECGNRFWRIIPRVLSLALVIFVLGVAVEAFRKQLARLYREKELCARLDRKAEALLRRMDSTK